MSRNKSKSLAYAAILLAICIVSQFLKNTSVYITGPIINACLLLCVLTAGIKYAVALSVITPITSFIITGSPIMAAIPMIIPCVIVGNIIYVICFF
ncbi:MAG: ECF transporter S component, partial [Clostridia bacterium]|nr:ECF transporter S component [Clostridia bacterium]